MDGTFCHDANVGSDGTLQAREEVKRQYIGDMRVTPVDEGFTFEYFSKLVEECCGSERRSIKGFLTQDQLIPGLGNSIAQDIMFNAGLHPKRSVGELDKAQKRGFMIRSSRPSMLR